MSCTTLDMTIDGALADPLVAAVMRADRVDPQRFEALLRSTAQNLAGKRRAGPPAFAFLAARVCKTMTASRPIS